MESDRRSILKLFDSNLWKTMTKEILARISKDNDMSNVMRIQGNEMFMRSSHSALLHEQILKMYTLSIAAAENKSESLAMAYGNRSALLLHIGKCEACIGDIDRALEISKNNPFKIKILCRKMECMHAIGISNIHGVIREAEALLDKIPDQSIREIHADLLSKTKLKLSKPSTLKICKDRRLETLDNINKSHSINDFSSVQLQYSEQYGRHLIAEKDFAPGEVIYVEKPHVMFLNIKKLHAYCSYCFSTKWANIPCNHCSWTMFCSEECKKEAWDQYHHIECSVYAWAKKDDYNDTCKQLAIRLLILALREAGSIENLKAELEAFDKEEDYTKGFIKNGEIKSHGFRTIYSLADQVPRDKEKERLQDTAMILRSIARNSTLFGENFDYRDLRAFKKSEDVLFIGALLFKLTKLSQLNKHEMWNGNYTCYYDLPRHFCWANECCSRGCYIAPVTGLLNHSCDPNVRRCFSEDKTVILYAVQPIKKGSQLFDCYQQEYYRHDIEPIPRQNLLAATYNFKCNCVACRKRWPHLTRLFMETQANRGAHMNYAEQKLAIKYRPIITSTLKEDTPYSIKDVKFMGEGIQKGLEVSSKKPSFTVMNIIINMNTIFERLCGIWLIVPSLCQKS